MSVVRKVRLRVPAGTAKPGPAIGQVGRLTGNGVMEGLESIECDASAPCLHLDTWR